MKTTMKLELEATIEIPALPNFINATSYPGENAVKTHSIPVADIKDDQLKEIGRLWTEALLKHAEERRKIRST